MQQGYWSRVAKRRMSRRRTLAAMGAAALGASLAAACGDEDRPDTAQGGLVAPVVDETANVKRGGAIKAKAPADVIDFDPYIFPNAQAVCAFVYGVCFSAVGLVWTNTLQEMVPPAKLGRVSSIDALGSFVLMPAGFATAGWLTDSIGPVRVFLLGGGATIALALLGVLHPGVRRLD